MRAEDFRLAQEGRRLFVGAVRSRSNHKSREFINHNLQSVESIRPSEHATFVTFPASAVAKSRKCTSQVTIPFRLTLTYGSRLTHGTRRVEWGSAGWSRREHRTGGSIPSLPPFRVPGDSRLACSRLGASTNSLTSQKETAARLGQPFPTRRTGLLDPTFVHLSASTPACSTGS